MNLPEEFVIENGRLIDPAQKMDAIGCVHVRNGGIVSAGTNAVGGPNLPRFDAAGCIVCPGLIDVHVHLREPGAPHKETIETGCRAAVAGGFTTVCCMPNTTPAIDTVEVVRWIKERAAQLGLCNVHPIAAITRNRAGRDLLDFKPLLHAGAVAFSDDGDGIEDDQVMRAALIQALDCNTLLTPHCEFKSISKRGLMHLGDVSRRLGLTGYDPRGEEAMIERDLALLADIMEECGTPPDRRGALLSVYHVAHVSTAAGIDMIRHAKSDRLPVSCEVCPHHLLLCDEDIVGEDGKPDPNFKMSPPLRSRADVDACLAGVIDGTIDCIVTDHAPHSAEEKAAGFVAAPMGIVGLETSLACAASALIGRGDFDWPQLIAAMTTHPARVFRLPGGTLADGNPADITIIDADAEWVIDPDRFETKSRNTPFGGWPMHGRAVATVAAGRLAYGRLPRIQL